MAEKTVKARVARKPLFQRGPLSVTGERDPNFEYRFVNDTGSRIHNFKQAGYEIVEDDGLIVGDARTSDASSIGSAKSVTSDDGTRSVLMRIKKEWYNEDQEAKAQQITEQEAAMKTEASQGMYGSVKTSR